MKAKKFNKKLVLNKMTVANLNNDEKGMVLGGGTEPLQCLPESAYSDCASICINKCPREPIDKPVTGAGCATNNQTCQCHPFDTPTFMC